MSKSVASDLTPLSSLIRDVINETKEHYDNEEKLMHQVESMRKEFRVRRTESSSKYGALRDFLKIYIDAKMVTDGIKLFDTSDKSSYVQSQSYKVLIKTLREEIYRRSRLRFCNSTEEKH